MENSAQIKDTKKPNQDIKLLTNNNTTSKKEKDIIKKQDNSDCKEVMKMMIARSGCIIG